MVQESTEQLSARELEILKLVVTGATNHQIAVELAISVNTVKTHLRNVFAKLGVESRTEATLSAIQRGLVQVEGAAVVDAVPEVVPPAAPIVPPVWPVRAGQWIALGAALLLVLLVAAWPGLRAQPSGLRNRLVDVPRDAALSASTPVPSRWLPRAQMPTPRGRFAQVTTNGLIYVIGGLTPEGWSDRVEVYDPLEDLWSRRQSLPYALANASAAQLGAQIVVPGGLGTDNQVSSRVQVYDPAADSWVSGPELPAPRCGYGLAELNGTLYLFGGWDGHKYVDTVYALGVGEDAWRPVDKLGVPRGFLAAAAWQDAILLSGGYDGNTDYDLVEAYRPAVAEGSRWQTLSPMSTARAGHAMAVMQNDVYVVGGGWEHPMAFNERYSVANDAWSAFESPVVGEWTSLGLSVAERKEGAFLFAIGGWDGAYLADVVAYQAVFRVYVP
jgi:DNA-binding CsgD family transcriptional regulator/N-acetylneuraminic acid mutarotase